jgi:hypothetical protein
VQSYTCANSTQSGTTSASLTLTDPPASVAAGQTLTLQAGLTLALPQSFDLAAKADLISQIGLSTTNFGLQVEVGSTVQVVPAAIVIGQLQSLGLSDETVTGSLTFPAVTVPRGASGEVTVSMPTAAQYANSASSSPAEVVFNATLGQENYIGTPSSSNLACYEPSTPAPAAQVIAQIPIQPGAAATTTKRTKTTTTAAATTTHKSTASKAGASKASTSKAATSKAATSKPTASASPAQSAASASAAQLTSASSAAADSSAGAAAATSAPATATPAASSSAAATAAAPAPASRSATASTSASTGDPSATPASTAATAAVTIPPRTVSSGTFIPTWELIVMGAVFPIAAVAYAWSMRRRFTAARTDLEQRRAAGLAHPSGSATRG